MNPQESDYASFFCLLKAIGYRGGLSVHAGTSAFADRRATRDYVSENTGARAGALTINQHSELNQ